MEEGRSVWGVLMDMAAPDWAMTVVSLVDGTTSFFTTGTFAVVGAGEEEGPASASRGLVKAVEWELKLFEPAADRDYPAPAMVRFWALTTDGLLMAEAPELALATGDHLLSPVYRAGQKAITQVRLVHEAGRAADREG